MTKQASRPSARWNFITGGLAGLFATCCVQPSEVVKIRLQISSEARAADFSIFTAIKDLYKNGGGIRAFYTGLDSALLRTAVYTTLRIGIFFSLSDLLKERKGGRHIILSPIEKISCAFVGGAISSFLATPFDVSLVRMQSDLATPQHLRRNYHNVFDALIRIANEEGIRGLWKGAQPTVTRAIAVNIAMLVSFEEAKQRLRKRLGDGKRTIFLASAISGIVVCLFSMPFDNVKMKLQKQQKAGTATPYYEGVIDCFKQTARREGIRGFYSGFPAYYMRLAPHTMITLFTTDLLKRALGV